MTSSDVPVARPSPSMIFLNMVKLGNQIVLLPRNVGQYHSLIYNQYHHEIIDIWNTKCVVKVDDSAAGIVAGLHAGCWTVGIAKTV